MKKKYPKEYIGDEKEVLIRFGKNLKYLREKAGLSQTEVEAKADMSRNQIGRIEMGKINTSLLNIVNIAKALDVDINVLFELPK